MIKKSIYLLTLISLTACGGDKKETYTTDYLYTNDDVRAKVLADCKENKQTPENCKNANEAEGIKKVEEYRKKTNK